MAKPSRVLRTATNAAATNANQILVLTKQLAQQHIVVDELMRGHDLIVKQLAESNLRLLYVMHQVITERPSSASPILVPGAAPRVERGTLWEFYQAERDAFLAQMEKVYADVEDEKRRALAQAEFEQRSGDPDVSGVQGSIS